MSFDHAWIATRTERAEIAAEIRSLDHQTANCRTACQSVFGNAVGHRNEDDAEPRLAQKRQLVAHHVRDAAVG